MKEGDCSSKQALHYFIYGANKYYLIKKSSTPSAIIPGLILREPHGVSLSPGQRHTIMTAEIEKKFTKTETPQDIHVAISKSIIVTEPNNDATGDINHIEKKPEKLTFEPAASSDSSRPCSTYNSQTMVQSTPTTIEELEAPSTSNQQLGLQTAENVPLPVRPPIIRPILLDNYNATRRPLGSVLPKARWYGDVVLHWAPSFINRLSLGCLIDWEIRMSAPLGRQGACGTRYLGRWRKR